MKSLKKRAVCFGFAAVVLAAGIVYTSFGNDNNKTVASSAIAVAAETKTPKYIFLFIGDGMSYPQIQLTNYFVSANNSEKSGQTVNVNGNDTPVLESKNNLTMMDFDVTGSAQTYNSTSFAPDSASTARNTAFYM